MVAFKSPVQLVFHWLALQDFFFDPYANRDYVFDVESVGVFPANERVQGRWNGDPYVPPGPCSM